MDLTEKLSFARFLRGKGIRVFIVDWGSPSESEKNFNVALYVTEILAPMAEWIRENTKGSLTYGGYCMGGVLALALACIRPELADSIAFFATPWDFSAPSFLRFVMRENEIEKLRESIRARDEIPPELIHLMFHYANPFAFQNKLREFVHMDSNDPLKQDFLAIENWVNDGVAMTKGVAEDCLIGWLQHNQPVNGQWRVGGKVVDPAQITIPCFVAAPKEDRIVPSDCALPLVSLLKNHTLIEPRSGHVSMMAGKERKSALWEPFVEWMESSLK
jgi:polyhydroxyalkanoate synthase